MRPDNTNPLFVDDDKIYYLARLTYPLSARPAEAKGTFPIVISGGARGYTTSKKA